MNKITRKLSQEQGWKHYRLCTADFSSLQVRLCCIDTALNEGGQDKVLTEVYQEGGLADLHAMTGYNTFVGPLHKKIFEADDGETKWLFLPEQKMRINRDGEDMTVKGSEIVETDRIVAYE